MHDCKISVITELRTSELKNYIKKLTALEKDFQETEKLNI